MQYETMKSRILSAPILINNFVKGIGPYTYEQYLIEVVNSTPYFLQNRKVLFILTQKRKIIASGIAFPLNMQWTLS